jgi:hypothetical protein
MTPTSLAKNISFRFKYLQIYLHRVDWLELLFCLAALSGAVGILVVIGLSHQVWPLPLEVA